MNGQVPSMQGNCITACIDEKGAGYIAFISPHHSAMKIKIFRLVPAVQI
jgi:hypothetical protein